MTMRNITHLILLLVIGMMMGACQPVAATGGEAAGPATLVLASHDSFTVSEAVVAQFEQEQNAKVQFLALGDAGEAVNRIILSKDAPLADVFFGVDNTFLSRALAAEVFEAYASPLLAEIPDELELDPQHTLLPVDVGYVNINADGEWFAQQGIPLPQTLEDLLLPAYRGLLVTPNPATSSPGLAFLLATISHFGEDGYQAFWAGLRANDLLVTDGWSEAYFEHFTVGSGGVGDRPLVISYTSSPPADVVYASDGRTVPASQNLNLAGGVFRQIEFVGLLKGAKQPELAKAWIDFMLDLRFQEDLPLQMFVYPARPDAELPELFQQYAEARPSQPRSMPPPSNKTGNAGSKPGPLSCCGNALQGEGRQQSKKQFTEITEYLLVCAFAGAQVGGANRALGSNIDNNLSIFVRLAPTENTRGFLCALCVSSVGSVNCFLCWLV